MSSIYEKIINYLIENPGSKPRQIADSIGESLSRVRRALYVLRDRGIIARSGQGYVVVKSRLRPPKESYIIESRQSESGKALRDEKEASRYTSISRREREVLDSKWLSEIITNILKSINELNKRISSLEKEIAVIRTRIESLEKNRNTEHDEFLALIKQRKTMTIEEARKYMQKSLEHYVVNNHVIIVGNLVIDKNHFEEFKKRFPLKISEIKKLDSNDLLILKEMIEEGIVYLHGGNEYRFVE